MKVSQPVPAHVLNALIKSELAVLRSRDAQLSSALDVAPPIIKEAAPVQIAAQRPQMLPGVPPGLYGYLRRGYRFLNRFGPLRPALQRMRSTAQAFKTRCHPASVQQPSPQVSIRSVDPARLILPRLSRSYTIAFTMRSGSNEICNLLARNGLGVPNEFFQNPLPPEPSGLLLNSFGRIVSRYQAEGVFGSKMSHDHRARLDEQLREIIPGYRRLDDLLPAHRWVWLRRRDKILQAISWCRAEQSNEWAIAGTGAPYSQELNYDFFHILSRVTMILSSELAWEAYFSREHIQPLVIIYEDFFADIPTHLRALIDYLGGLNGRSDVDCGLTYHVQRNEKSYALRERFVSDLCRIGENRMIQELGEPVQRWASFLLNREWRGQP